MPWVARALAAIAIALYGIGAGAAANADKPKVMVVIEEKVAGLFGTTGSESTGQAESALATRLIAAGFTVVDANTVRRNIPRDKALRLLEGDDKAAAMAGLQFGAQVVILGKSSSKNAGGKLLGTNMQTLQATVEVRAIWSDDGRVITAHMAQSSKAHIDELQGGVLAIQEAAREAADLLTAALVREVETSLAGGGSGITLMISGLVSYRHLAFVQQFLQSGVPGVNGVQMRQFAHGTAEIALNYAGQSNAVALQLANQKFVGFRLEPTSVTANRLDIRAVLER